MGTLVVFALALLVVAFMVVSILMIDENESDILEKALLTVMHVIELLHASASSRDCFKFVLT